MTEIQALKESLDLWFWLYQNPGKIKHNSPYWHLIENYREYCPLCEFSYWSHDSYCHNNCPGRVMRNSCFGKAYLLWLTKAGMSMDAEDKHTVKLAAAYIASKIRRRLRKLKG